VNYFEGRGTQTQTPYKQTSFEKAYWPTDGVAFWVLGPAQRTATSATRELHDACLIVKAHLGNRACLFTGDASDTNLQDVATMSNICNDILHASHHGSINGADLDFIKACNADYTVISTTEGAHENVPHPVALRRYADNTKIKVYRTDRDGSQRWDF